MHQPGVPGPGPAKSDSFASRGAMDIDGMGPAVVRQLVEKGLVHNAADVYSLEKSQLLTLDKFKQKRQTTC